MDSIGEFIRDLVDAGFERNIITVITQLISTLILFLLIKYFLWEKIQAFIAQRQEVIVGELESARTARSEAIKMKEDYESELKDAKKRASDIVENAKSVAIETKNQIISEAEREAQYKIEKAEKDIESERKRIETELRSHLVDIAFTAAEKLVNENVDNDKNRKLIDQFIEEVGE